MVYMDTEGWLEVWEWKQGYWHVWQSFSPNFDFYRGQSDLGPDKLGRTLLGEL